MLLGFWEGVEKYSNHSAFELRSGTFATPEGTESR